MAQIRVQSLHKSFGDFVAVKDSNFTVEDGEFFCLLGPSGCGKTTTLRMIAGLELPTSGRILLAGEDVTLKRASARDIAFVFQLFALYPHMNVRRNIAFPLVSMGVKRAEVKTRVEEAARILRITELLDRPVSGLSGGDRQRVALGRAIVRRPLAFMMDEPLGALDFGVPSGDVRRAARTARPAQGHHRLCHARPDRGDVAWRQDRGDEPWRDRTAGRAAGDL